MRSINYVFIFLFFLSCQSKKLVINKKYSISGKTNLIFLHGYGGNENKMNYVNKTTFNNYHIYFVRAPYKLNVDSYSWFDLKYQEDSNSWVEISQANKSIQKIVTLIDSLEGESIIVGESQGAILALTIGINYPNKVSKVVAINGYMDSLLIDREKTYNNSEFYIVNGSNDFIINQKLVKETVSLLNELNIKTTIKTHQNQHSISEEDFEKIKKWIDDKSIFKKGYK